jgi:putative CRISPR-associated protein (TIGR02620 family)
MKTEWSNKIRNRGRQPYALVLENGSWRVWSGNPIKGIIRIVSSRYEKAGKWSGTDYVLDIVPGKFVSFCQPFDGWGETWKDISKGFEMPGCPDADMVKLAKDVFASGVLKQGGVLHTACLEAQANEGPLTGPETIIVTRHNTLVQWLAQHGITGKVISQATADDVRGKIVYGILPLWLAAEAESVTEVSMSGLPLEARQRVNGGDYTTEQMNDWGAEMRTFIVRKQ